MNLYHLEIPLIILFNIIIYYKTIWYDIIVDDFRHYRWLRENKGFNSCNHLPLWRRPFYWIQQRFYGAGFFGVKIRKNKDGKEKMDFRYDHGFTLFLHILTSILIYFAFGGNYISLAAALMYSCNPMNTQTSVWLNGRRYLMTVIVVLLMMLTKPFGFIIYFLTPLFQLTGFFAPILYADSHPIFLLGMPILLIVVYKNIQEKEKQRLEKVHATDYKKISLGRILVVIKSIGFNFYHIIFPGIVRMHYKCLYWWGRTEEGNKEAYSFNYEAIKGFSAIALMILGLFIFNKPMWIFMCLSIIQWCCIFVFYQYNTDRYMSMANPFMMYFIALTSFTYLGHYWFIIPLCFCIYYISCLIPSLNQYKNMQYFFDHHRYFDPELPNIRLEEVKGLMRKDSFPARIRAMCLMHEAVIRHKTTDYNSLVFAAEVTRLWGNLEEADQLFKIAKERKFIGWEDVSERDYNEFKERLNRDMAAKEHMQNKSRQVRRAEARKTKEK